MTPAERQAALEEQADRIKKRLDHLNAHLSGGSPWVELFEDVNVPGTFRVVLDKALTEERQQALAYATVLRTLAGLGAEEVPAADTAEDQLEKRRREREQRRAAQ